jgi:hypothetical protein
MYRWPAGVVDDSGYVKLNKQSQQKKEMVHQLGSLDVGQKLLTIRQSNFIYVMLPMYSAGVHKFSTMSRSCIQIPGTRRVT